MSAAAEKARFTSFREFYPFYLSEHRNRTCRRLHFIGTTLALG
ncbi:MAG: Mpo1-like protein, partial [Betaproteobacteria bacterium]